ncbi:MAG TPA: tetratricopeptide repeat protein [Kofleriaceae bacterium]|nr:tetratricopeptide repeat protein [Kofleriaceae bacterium]
MPALRKPHRVAFLLPELSITSAGTDAAYAAEAAVLVWSACIETCRRHPGLAVYDAESTPLEPSDGHFAPRYAVVGATPTDAFFSSTRRDELVWLELALPAGAVRLHALGRGGKREAFDAIGRSVGEQIGHVLDSWAKARGLGALPKRFDPITADELFATVRVLGPVLVEQARKWTRPAPPPSGSLEGGEEPEPEPAPVADAPAVERAVIAEPDEIDAAIDALVTLDTGISSPGEIETTMREPATPMATRTLTAVKPVAAKPIGSVVARTTANRLPAALKVPALRVLELVLRENLGELILAVDPEHPQALFARFVDERAHRTGGTDVALLRRVIAAAPGWALPYGELVGRGEPEAPSSLETVAGAGIAALCRPAQLDVIATAARHLQDDGRIDEAVRLMARAVGLHDHDSRAHSSLLQLHASTDRVGAWLDQAERSAAQHGCPLDPQLPWYPDQIQIDLHVADALMAAGRVDEAIALRANRLAGRDATWPRHTKLLTTWRKDPRYVAWAFAREGWFRGDVARAVDGFARMPPNDSLDVAIFLDALVAMGRDDEVALAWGHFGLGRGLDGSVARLAAARCLMIAGEWRRGLEELWRVELGDPCRDEHVAIARCGLLMSIMPLEIAEQALAERVAIGASTLARRMARDVADFVPGAAKSSIVLRALGQVAKTAMIELDPSSLAGFARDTAGKAAIDALFAEIPVETEGNERHALAAERRAARRGTRVESRSTQSNIVLDWLPIADRLVNRWLDVVFAAAPDGDPRALAQAGAYVAANALGRYLAATTQAPSPFAGALRTVAGEALALVRAHQHALGDRDARALLATLDPLLRRVDRWVGTSWLATVERSCGIDERADGDVAGFARECATVGARILGPEEAAVLSTSVARLHRERPDGWEGACAAQAARLVQHTGHVGVDEWADATAAQLAARAIDPDDAIDALHTACYLAEGKTAAPCVQAARVLFDAGRAPAALAVLSTGLAAATPAWRARQLQTLAEPWKRSKLDTPIAFDKVASAMFEALQKGEHARAEKLGRWAVALEPDNTEAHRNLGLALAHQGKLVDALHHLVRGTHEQATQILSGVLYQAGKLVEALAILDYISRWYVRAEQWLSYAAITYAAMDNPRTARAYGLAYQLDPDAFDATQLNAYAGVLDEIGDHAQCEIVAAQLLRIAGDDLMWKTNAWNHLACAYIGLGKFDAAVELAQQAVEHNPLPDQQPGFAATLDRARKKQRPLKSIVKPSAKDESAKLDRSAREPVFALLEAGDFATAAALAADPSTESWRTRRAAIQATRFRFAAENAVAVTPRARAAAAAALVDTVGLVERDAVLCRMLALEIREQAYFARDPVPRLGDRMTREAFARELRARGGVVFGEPAPPPTPFVDRVVVAGAKIERASDYIALLRDLAALTPADALAQFDLDDASYLDVARAWADAIAADPAVARLIEAGLAKA